MTIQLVFWMIIVFVILQEASAQESSLAMPGCQPKCGNISIPYPFGIGVNCSANHNFTITCNNSYIPPRPFLGNISMDVLEISIDDGTIRVSNPLIQDQRFTTVMAWSTYWGCVRDSLMCGENTYCSSLGLCYCKNGYGGNPYMPNGCQDIDECASPSSCNSHGCINEPGGYSCDCSSGYKLAGDRRSCYPDNTTRTAIIDIDECSLRYDNYNFSSGGWYYSSINRTLQYDYSRICDSHGCINEPVGGYTCSCSSGYKLAGGGHWCYPEAPDNKTRNAIIGISSGIGGLILLGIAWWLYKLLQRRKEKKLKKKFFKKNGGLLLQQQISSSEGNVEKNKIFTSKELEKATDHYNKDRILGQGGQGTVYKGMLTDGRIVAVKKSKIEDESELEPFINEVVILSKIDQRNIVKLHGCCLETEVPLLVYEFIPNGTLFQYIHEQNEDFPLSWDVRIRVAKEVAGALFYLHSSASIPIYHRDIKSTNILLDEKYRAKVADFGTSRSTTIDQTHFTTRVQGTFGYLDSEYFQSSQFTDKSDVYSFGVVLVELLTGQKPILLDKSEDEGRSLATFFILAMEQDRLLDILDPRVMKDGRKEEILGLANLAHRCLNLNGRKRPTMRQVIVELEGITLPIGEASPHQHYDEVEYAAAELIGPWETTSTTMESSTINSTSIDVEPLLHSPS